MVAKIFAVLMLCFAFAGTAMAQDAGLGGNLISFRNHALPVLVRVNADGKVTSISPAVQLRPNMRRMLRRTLEQMVTSPAKRDGHGVASQFVIQLALKARKRPDGKYAVRFAYVSAMPVPMMSLYWVRTDDQLALEQAHDSSIRFMPGRTHPVLPPVVTMPNGMPASSTVSIGTASAGARPVSGGQLKRY